MFEGTYFFILTSFNTAPLILLVKIILMRNHKSVKGDYSGGLHFSGLNFQPIFI